MLERWETELLSRPAEVKNSAHGRAATRQFKECKTNLKQFFKGCKSDSVHVDVIGGVSKNSNVLTRTGVCESPRPIHAYGHRKRTVAYWCDSCWNSRPQPVERE